MFIKKEIMFLRFGILLAVLTVQSCSVFGRGTQSPDFQPPSSTKSVSENPSPTLPEPGTEIPMKTSTPAFVPPSGYKEYEDEVLGLSIFLPEDWIVVSANPGESAIFQSYPRDKYIGGEVFEPGDTKCDLNIRPPEITVSDAIQQLKSDSNTTILSEEEIVLRNSKLGTRIRSEGLGRAALLFAEIRERTVVLACFGELEPFDEISVTLGVEE